MGGKLIAKLGQHDLTMEDMLVQLPVLIKLLEDAGRPVKYAVILPRMPARLGMLAIITLFNTSEPDMS